MAAVLILHTWVWRQNVNAMHIMEGYLPGGFCIAWGVICLPFPVDGLSLHPEILK